MSYNCIPLTCSSVAMQPRGQAAPLQQQPIKAAVDPRERRQHLSSQELYRYRLESDEVLTLRVLAGTLWVTMENDKTDYVLSQGSPSSFHGPGLLVMEALEDAAVMVIEPMLRC